NRHDRARPAPSHPKDAEAPARGKGSPARRHRKGQRAAAQSDVRDLSRSVGRTDQGVSRLRAEEREGVAVRAEGEPMRESPGTGKRRLLGAAGSSGLVLLSAGLVRPPDSAFAAQRAHPARSKEAKSQSKDENEEVTPPEDLMREHGVLDRVLLIYEAGRA